MNERHLTSNTNVQRLNVGQPLNAGAAVAAVKASAAVLCAKKGVKRSPS